MKNIIKTSYLLIAYITCSIILYSAIKFPIGRAPLLYIGFLLSCVFFYYFYEKIINLKIVINDPFELIAPTLFFNIFVLFIYYLSSFELGLPSNIFRISFNFGNFMDFITLPATYNSRTFDWISTGHFPLAYALSKFFSDISGWEKNSIDVRQMIYLYFGVYIIFMLPLLILINNSLKKLNIDSKIKFLYWIFFLGSYPILVGFERGNFALIASSLMSIYVLMYQKNSFRVCAIIVGVAASIKTINLVFLLLLISRSKRDELLIAIAVFIFVTILSLIYIFGFTPSEWLIFAKAIMAPINSSVIFTDANKLIATSGWDSFRSFIYVLLNGISSDITSHSNIFSRLMLIFAGILFILFLLFRKKPYLWYQEAIFIISLPLAFHSSSGDYNIAILIPFLLVMLVNYKFNNNSYIFSIYSLTFILISGFALGYISCCGDGTGRSIAISIKSALTPFALTAGCILILNNLFSSYKVNS